ncbi:acyl-ACP thioesterase [Bacteroidia bacterium]|nr:acyl-ACP thioesterase [Bacteroidia bacterium]
MNTSSSLFSETHTIATYQVDSNCRLTIPNVLMLLQEIAWKHVNIHQLGYQDLHRQGLFWVLAKMKLVMHRYPKWTDTLQLNTWSKQPELLTAFRDFEGRDEQGNLYFSATSSWHILSLASGRPQAMTDFAKAFPHLAGEHAIAAPPAKLPAPANPQQTSNGVVHPSDIDMHLHVNNTRYVQWVVDSFGFEFLQHNAIQEMEVNFLSQAKDGDAYNVLTTALSDTEYITAVQGQSNLKDWVRVRIVWAL